MPSDEHYDNDDSQFEESDKTGPGSGTAPSPNNHGPSRPTAATSPGHPSRRVNQIASTVMTIPNYGVIETAVVAVVRHILTLKLLLSRFGTTMAKMMGSLKAWIRANPKLASLMVAGIILFILCCATPAILGAIGFSASGPVLGSVAAGWQALIGPVAGGSLFAFLQSAAMGGAAMGLVTGVGVFGIFIALGSSLATVHVVKKICAQLHAKVAEAAKVVKGACQQQGGWLWQKFKSSFSKTKTD